MSSRVEGRCSQRRCEHIGHRIPCRPHPRRGKERTMLLQRSRIAAIFAIAILVRLAGCTIELTGCESDGDCNGDRVCQSGQCVDSGSVGDDGSGPGSELMCVTAGSNCACFPTTNTEQVNDVECGPSTYPDMV